MQDFTLSGNRWFDSLSQPVLLVQNGTILYYNQAAQALFAQTDTPLTDGGAAPDILPEGETDCVTEVVAAGIRWNLQMQQQKAGTLCLFTQIEQTDPLRMSQLAAQLRMRLSTLNLAAEGLQNNLGEFLERQNQRWIAHQNQSLHQLLRLTEQLEFYGQTEDELRMLYPPAVLNLKRIGEDLALLLESLNRDSVLTFTYQAPDQDLFVAANEELLRKLVYNLAANAFEADGNVTMKLKKRGVYAVLSLSDDGNGISAPVYSSLFAPEQRSSTGYAPGFGLGLPLCQRIAALYGGRLVVSPLKKGTQVVLSLPLLQPETVRLLRSPAPMSEEDARQQALTELSVVLPYHCFDPDNI